MRGLCSYNPTDFFREHFSCAELQTSRSISERREHDGMGLAPTCLTAGYLEHDTLKRKFLNAMYYERVKKCQKNDESFCEKYLNQV